MILTNYELYLKLEKTMELLQDAMDAVWLELSDEEHKKLDDRNVDCSDYQIKQLEAELADRNETVKALTETWEECERRADSLRAELATMETAVIECAREIRSHEKRITERALTVTNLKAKVVKLKELGWDLLTYLPDSVMRYKYAWDECLSDEQDAVKEMRTRAETILTETEE
jgi:chromosome segregation ATPase